MLFTDFKYEWLLEEFTSNIQKELDFEQEAINMELVKQILIKEKFNDDVIVPKVLRSPTKRLLIMEYCHGFHVDEI
jgi:predicted unusual protein kinase regulating ubiquinone biosynthesis (AarF/ABC1/UbiB family)